MRGFPTITSFGFIGINFGSGVVLGTGSVWNSLIWSQYFPVSLQEATSKVGRHKAFVYAPLLLGHWYEIMALYYVKSILTEISVSSQKKQNNQNQISEQMGHA